MTELCQDCLIKIRNMNFAMRRRELGEKDAEKEVAALRNEGVSEDVSIDVKILINEMVRRRNLIVNAGGDVSNIDNFINSAKASYLGRDYEGAVANIGPCISILSTEYEKALSRGGMKLVAQEQAQQLKQDITNVAKAPYTSALSTAPPEKLEQAKAALSKAEQLIKNERYDEAMAELSAFQLIKRDEGSKTSTAKPEMPCPRCGKPTKGGGLCISCQNEARKKS